MIVHFTYMAQIKTILGCSKESVTLPDNCQLQDAIHDLVRRGGQDIDALLFEQGPQFEQDQQLEQDQKQTKRLRRIILVFIGDEQFFWDDNPLLTDNCELTFLSPIAGG